MEVSGKLDQVYQQTLQLRELASQAEVAPELLDEALKALCLVLEELHAADEELLEQNRNLLDAQRLLEIERQRYATLFELAPDGYLVTDTVGLIRQANRAAAALCGRPQADLEQKPLIVFVAAADRPSFQARLADPHAQQDWEITLAGPNREPVRVAITVASLNNPQGQGATLLWLLRDITQRKQIEQQLRLAYDHLEQQVAARTAELTEANARLQQERDHHRQAAKTVRKQAALIDIVPDAIYTQNLQGIIEFWSRGAECLYELPAAAALGQPADRLLQLKPSAHTPPATDSSSWQGELEYITPSGQSRVVLSRRTPMYDPSEQPQAVLVVNTDITAIKQLEAQVYRAQRIDSLGTMASGIAHDLNNAIGPILTATDFLLKPSQAELQPHRELLTLIRSSAQRSVDLIQRLLTFGRGTSEKRVPLLIRQPLLEVAALLEQTTARSIEICPQIPADLTFYVVANPTQLHQILMNLCINACDAMPAGGTLTLTLAPYQLSPTEAQAYVDARPGDYVVITVADSGLGISPQSLERIFDPFFTTKPAGQGTGLGLSTVFSLVKSHGGFVQVSSELGHGSQFRVYLPVAAAPNPAPLPAAAPNAEPPGPPPPRPGPDG
ncbi:MAG: PAS domain S-box protein [Leptolyngbya sp. DLM2.Bin27]|nr:MAG: PAS domain S-box protein [Leptolyngbya sp. DLM2.Bin27]